MEYVNINKYLFYIGVNRFGDGLCFLVVYLVIGIGLILFFGEKYISGVGDGLFRILYYGFLLKEIMGLILIKNKYLFV